MADVTLNPNNLDDPRRRRNTATPRRIPPPAFDAGATVDVIDAAEAGDAGLPLDGASAAAGRPADIARLEADLQQQLDALQQRYIDVEKQCRRLQRLASMGTMSAMLAHEFRNLLTPVISYSQYALSKSATPGGPFTPSDPVIVERALSTTLKNAQTAAKLCERIMRMADDAAAVGRAGVRAAVDDAILCLGRGLDRDNIEFDLRVDESLAVRMEPIELQQVLFNLIVNARQAMLDRPGRLSIAAEVVDASSKPSPLGRRGLGEGANHGADAGANSAQAAPLSPFVRITVADTGCGIRREDMEQIFEPFFTTKSRGDQPDRRGVGLGLTICKRLVEAAGGTLSVASRFSEGTTFTIELPGA